MTREIEFLRVYLSGLFTPYGVIGAVTRKSSAVRQALARNCSRQRLTFNVKRSTINDRVVAFGIDDRTRYQSGLFTPYGVIGAVTRKSSAARQALARNCEITGRQP